MEPTTFDELTKALATATSRRQALKTIAATALGSLLGLSGIGTAFAKNKSCAQFCAAVFGDNTSAAEQCAADAARGRGLCFSCGPASPSGGVAPTSICCTRNSSGYCSSYSTTLPCSCDANQCLRCDSTNGTCVSSCDASQCQTCKGGTCASSCDSCSTCQSGTCVSTCTSSQFCQHGTCVTAPCTNPSTDACHVNFSSSCCGGQCFCVEGVEGGIYCSNGGGCFPCSSDSDCVAQFGAGFPICQSASCCGSGTACVSASCNLC